MVSGTETTLASGEPANEGAPGIPVPIPTAVLAKLTVAEIKAELKSRNVGPFSTLRKKELLEKLKQSLHLPVVHVVSVPTKKAKKSSNTNKDLETDEKAIAWNEEHPARKLLYDELKDGAIPIDPDAMGPQEVYNNYKGTLEFKMKGMEFGPTFTARLKRLREIVERDEGRAEKDKRALKQAMANHPLRPLNHRGQPHWNGSVAQALLQCDTSVGKLKKLDASGTLVKRDPSELRMDRIECQAATSVDQFRWKVPQEIRTQKYLYTLKYNAEEKLNKNLEKGVKAREKRVNAASAAGGQPYRE